MSVLKEVLAWSEDRPAWQRDALRRLVEKGEINADDIGALAEICKSGYGLTEPNPGDSLAAHHLPIVGTELGDVSLDSIFHDKGVNALAENQTLKFGPRLTVVYGDNGAGKTGYIRILKSACRARGRETILGNVVSGVAPPRAAVSIKYKVKGEPSLREWMGQSDDDYVARVSVFDTQSAAVYLTDKTEVAFRPMGLDLFDKLVQVCKAVRAQLEAEQRGLGVTRTLILEQEVPQGTAVARLLANLTVLTKIETVETLATLSDAERTRHELVEKSLLDLQANDPVKLTQQLKLRAARILTLSQHLGRVETALATAAVTAVFDARTTLRGKHQEAERLRVATFPDDLLSGTGSPDWKAVWEAAKTFSEEQAYTGKTFPHVGEGAQCVLCQQGLDQDASNRLTRFEAFVTSTTERELREAKISFNTLAKAITDLVVHSDSARDAVGELRMENESLADQVETTIAALENRRRKIAEVLAANAHFPQDFPVPTPIQSEVGILVGQLQERLTTLETDTSAEMRRQLTAEAQELRARSLLAKNKQLVLAEIDRKKRAAAYEQAIAETKTAAITKKSGEVTRAVVTKRLKASFQAELHSLSFRHVEVELKEVGGSEGVLYHKLALTRAPGVDLPRVVSEGEQRCLSIAAFFAELSTADDASGIVFDDPVSSLDYRWREGVARRLVEEAKQRQVIVFTHDVVFLLFLKNFAQDQQVEQLDQHVRQLSAGAGVTSDELPWVAMPIRGKIGYLKKEMQSAEKQFREGKQAAYEREAQFLYGLLREAWERALEEVLLCKIVERYRPSVQTQQIAKIADVTDEDCRQIEAGMTKCSRWLPGHDQAAAARAPVPNPDELKADIDALDNWVKGINKRRN